jgi:hypothetical protein
VGQSAHSCDSRQYEEVHQAPQLHQVVLQSIDDKEALRLSTGHKKHCFVQSACSCDSRQYEEQAPKLHQVVLQP